jgi:hypothetical protein
MIVLWGVSRDRPLRAVLKELQLANRDVVLIDQTDVLTTEVDLTVRDGDVNGSVSTAGTVVDLARVTALYARPYDWRRVCIAKGIAAGSDSWDHAQRVEESLSAWWFIARGTVVNPPGAMALNGSKPLQSDHIRRAGFAVPETLVTTTVKDAEVFWAEHRDVIYKSVSSVRSRVARLTERDRNRLADVSSCPTQFQRYVQGTDVRVHVVGDEVFACEILTDADDYRYTSDEGQSPHIRSCTLPTDIRDRCRSMASRMGLCVAGIDLRRGPDGGWVCFEVNPSPGFTFYESATGQPIAAAVARLLGQGQPAVPSIAE